MDKTTGNILNRPVKQIRDRNFTYSAQEENKTETVMSLKEQKMN